MNRYSIKCFLIFALFICLGCSKYTLQNYKGWKLSEEYRTNHSEFRNFRSGHLLVKGNSSIISIDIVEKSIWDIGKTDTSKCSHINVEIPSLDKKSLPAKIKNPKSYLKICSCTWGNCKEEPLTEGEVEVTDITNDGLIAKIDITFPSVSINRKGFFKYQNPDWIKIYSDAETPENVKNSWKIFQIE